MITNIRIPVKIILKAKAGTCGIIMWATAPIPCISAPIFSVIAGILNNSMRYKILFG